MPAGQVQQLELPVPPVYFPAGQLMHPIWPTPDWNVPAAHDWHCLASCALSRESSPDFPEVHATQNVAL